MNNFGNLIATRRKELKMTQKELALKLNVSDKTISKWETGASYPEVTMLSTIAKVLEVNVNDFFGVEDLREKKIDMEEHESYDNNIINKYKNRIFITMALIIGGFILMLSCALIEDEDIHFVMIALGMILEVGAIFNFISNNIAFRSFYSEKFYIRKYDRTFFTYSSATIIVLSSYFVLHPLLVTPSLNLFIIKGIINFGSNLFIVISYFLIVKIAKMSNFKLKRDLLNKILIVVAIIHTILLVLLSGAYLWFLNTISLLYILIYIIIMRREYVNK